MAALPSFDVNLEVAYGPETMAVQTPQAARLAVTIDSVDNTYGAGEGYATACASSYQRAQTLVVASGFHGERYLLEQTVEADITGLETASFTAVVLQPQPFGMCGALLRQSETAYAQWQPLDGRQAAQYQRKLAGLVKHKAFKYTLAGAYGLDPEPLLAQARLLGLEC